VGTYDELRQRPANAFVAGFLGSPPMNLLAGWTVESGGLRFGEGESRVVVPLPAVVQERVHAGQRVTLGIRPEAARLVSDDLPTPDGARLRGVVEVVQPDFAHKTQLVYVRTGELAYAAVGALDVGLNIGEEVEVLFPVDQLYFFDGASEQRIG